MKRLIILSLVMGSWLLFSACAAIRIGTDPRIVDLSREELRYNCRLEEKMRTLAAATRDKDAQTEFARQCEGLLGVQASSPSIKDAEKNRQKADADSQKIILNWEFALKRTQARAQYSDKALAGEIIELGRQQQEELHRFTEERAGESGLTIAAAQTFYGAAVQLRKNQAGLHTCLDFSLGQALEQMIRFNFRPIKDQCFLDVETLKAQRKALEEIAQTFRQSSKK
jgi:hypothetical protein